MINTGWCLADFSHSASDLDHLSASTPVLAIALEDGRYELRVNEQRTLALLDGYGRDLEWLDGQFTRAGFSRADDGRLSYLGSFENEWDRDELLDAVTYGVHSWQETNEDELKVELERALLLEPCSHGFVTTVPIDESTILQLLDTVPLVATLNRKTLRVYMDEEALRPIQFSREYPPNWAQYFLADENGFQTEESDLGTVYSKEFDSFREALILFYGLRHGWYPWIAEVEVQRVVDQKLPEARREIFGQ